MTEIRENSHTCMLLSVLQLLPVLTILGLSQPSAFDANALTNCATDAVYGLIIIKHLNLFTL